MGCAWIWAGATQGAQTAISFNRDVRPVLSEKCFACHGLDSHGRKGDLRLDVRGDALEAGAIVPGQPSKSEAVSRIFSSDTDDIMPPPESKMEMTTAEKNLIKQWIEEGAVYEPHWSFISVPEVVAVPESDDHPIDAFVLHTLEDEGLGLQPEASKTTLIRRLSFDLTGLPPTPEEVRAFVADTNPTAYESLVDRLLASERYGEWMAVEWMDLSRFADTYGYQSDRVRDMSPWRDWVIRAFNDNLPYDQFVIWQVAGDLLPEPTRDQVLATAFNRHHRQTNEGGSIEEEFRIEYASDRVHTMGTAFMGLTLECARCHDHKFDPVGQRDYYGLTAFFNSIDESGLYSHFTNATPTPSLLLYEQDDEAKHRALSRVIEEKVKALAGVVVAQKENFSHWKGAWKPEDVKVPHPVAAFGFDEKDDKGFADAVGKQARAALPKDAEWVEGRTGKAVKFDGDMAMTFGPGIGNFGRYDPFSFSIWLKADSLRDRCVVLHRCVAESDAASRGYELQLDQERPMFSLIHFWPGNAIRVRAKEVMPKGEWAHVAVTYDGSSRAAGVSLYINGKACEVEVLRDNLFKDIRHHKSWGDSSPEKQELALAARFRDLGFRDGLVDDLSVYDLELSPVEVARLAETKAALSDKSLFEHFIARHSPLVSEVRVALKQLRDQEGALVDAVPEIAVMSELDSPRPTFVLERGQYDAPGEAVGRQVPESILRWNEAWPQNRLGLARWLTDAAHPLTARVAANRVWKNHFGRGLVATPNDFGNQGQPPTHPGLLDWLARRLMDSGWDLKALHKAVVMSRTYRQSSSAAMALITEDPHNTKLARGPRHRLAAEAIRDQALAVSGLMHPLIGGPSVKPYQPARLWEESGVAGGGSAEDRGEKLYRRSLYTFWKRTLPPPSMSLFDAPSREVCTASRESTTTPLQALVLLNDPQFVEAARVTAEGLLKENGEAGLKQSRRAGEDEDLLGKAFFRVLGREPSRDEMAALKRLLLAQSAHFEKDPTSAAELLKVGARKPDASLPAVQVAALTTVIQALMSHFEFVNQI